MKTPAAGVCDLERLIPKEVTLSAPWLRGNNLISAWFVADDIYIEEPRAMLLMAYRQAGDRLGMETIGHTPATGIVVRNGEVAAVETPSGRIDTRWWSIPLAPGRARLVRWRSLTFRFNRFVTSFGLPRRSRASTRTSRSCG